MRANPCVQMADWTANQRASRAGLGSCSEGQATRVCQRDSPLAVVELALGHARLVEDRPCATGVPQTPVPLSMTASPWSDSLQRREPEHLASELTCPRGVRRSATEAREAVIGLHEDHSHLFQLLDRSTISTDVYGCQAFASDFLAIPKGSP